MKGTSGADSSAMSSAASPSNCGIVKSDRMRCGRKSLSALRNAGSVSTRWWTQPMPLRSSCFTASSASVAHVLDNQYAQVQWHPVLRGRSRHPQHRRLAPQAMRKVGVLPRIMPAALMRPPWRKIRIVRSRPTHPGALRGPTHIRSLTAPRDGNISHAGGIPAET